MSICLPCMYWHRCRDQSYGFTIHLYGIFLAAASFALDMVSLHDLQKLAGKSDSVVAGVKVEACSKFHRESLDCLGKIFFNNLCPAVSLALDIDKFRSKHVISVY